MDTKDLKEFVVLAQTGNFLEAAEILYSSQSTLSKHIKGIESEFGVRLFDRTTRKVVLSKFDRLLLPYARQIVEMEEKLANELKTSISTDHNSLTIGTILAMAEYNITDVLVSYKKKYPLSTMNVIQVGADDLKQLLRERKCDLAFIHDIRGVMDPSAESSDSDRDIKKIPYTEDALVAILPAGHPLANEKKLPLKRLAGENFILFDQHTLPYHLSMMVFEKCGITPHIAGSDQRYENIMDMVIKGMGIALMMKRLVLHIPNPNIAMVEITPRISTNIALCHLANAHLSEAARMFIDCAKALKMGKS